MTEKDIQHATTERLKGYYPFSQATIQAVASFAKKQADFKTYQDFFTAVGVPTPNIFLAKNGKGVPVVDIKPRIQPEKGVLVVHLPMGNPLDPNQLYHLATIAGVNAAYRVIGFGNPGGGKYNFREQNLNAWQLLGIASTLNPKHLVAAELEYLQQQGIRQVYQIGYSYGALKALLSGIFAPQNSVRGAVIIEPVSHRRGLLQLKSDFEATFEPMGGYVHAPQLQTFHDARKPEPTKKEIQEGLTRPISISIAFLLALSNLKNVITRFFRVQPSASLTLAWGSKSELSNDGRMRQLAKEVSEEKSGVKTIRLPGQKHALANDVHLYAAIVHEALSDGQG